MNNTDSKTVIVLGMHRSGTSMTGAILNELGVNMGKKLLGKDPTNPIGHFEDLNFLYLNIEILRTSGGNWAHPPKKEVILQQKKRFEEKIKMLTNKPDLEIWGWKDPRTSLTVDLYLPYLKQPYFIVCHRNAEDICKSLYKRNNFNLERSMKLIKIYEERIEDFFYRNKNLNKLDLYYNDALNAPQKYVDNIIKFLKLEINEGLSKRAINLILSKQELKELVKKK